jgi:hypothetical protein
VRFIDEVLSNGYITLAQILESRQAKKRSGLQDLEGSFQNWNNARAPVPLNTGVFLVLASWNRLKLPARNHAVYHAVFQCRFGLKDIVTVNISGNFVHLLPGCVGKDLIE